MHYVIMAIVGNHTSSGLRLALLILIALGLIVSTFLWIRESRSRRRDQNEKHK